MKEGDDTQRIKKNSRSLCSKSSSSNSSSRSSSSKSLKLSTKERAIQEKVCLADLQAEAIFMQKKRYTELQAESLWIEVEMAKVQARVRIYEGENIDQKVPFLFEDINNGRYIRISGSKQGIKCSYTIPG